MSEGNGYATRESFLGGFKRRFKEVDVPMLGKVKIGNQSERERQAFELWMRPKGQAIPARLKVARLKYIVDNTYTVDEAKMFSDADIPALCDVDYAVTDKLWDEISNWIGLNGADLEELAKNCESNAGAVLP